MEPWTIPLFNLQSPNAYFIEYNGSGTFTNGSQIKDFFKKIYKFETASE